MPNNEGHTPEKTVTNAGAEWTSEEINAATRTYLWMLGAIEEGFSPVKKRAREAALAAMKRVTVLDASKRLQMLDDPLLGRVW